MLPKTGLTLGLCRQDVYPAWPDQAVDHRVSGYGDVNSVHESVGDKIHSKYK